MYNKKVLSKAVANLDKAKAPVTKPNITVDPNGYWNPANEGKPVRIPGNKITMKPNPKTGKPIPYPVVAYPNVGQPQIMYPGKDYYFAGAKYVDEDSRMKKGGEKKYSKSLMATNKLFTPNKLFKKKKKNKKIFDPNAKYYQNGGFKEENKLEDKLLNRYPGFKKALGTEGENLHIIADPNFKAGEHGYGDIEVMFPHVDQIEYTPDYTYKSPFPGDYVIPYNPNSDINKGDIFLDMLHLLRNDEEVQPYIDMFRTAALDQRGDDLMWAWDDEKQNPDYIKALESSGTNAFEQFEKNYIDGLLRSELTRRGMGRKTTDKGYKLERSAGSPEMRKAANEIYKYLKTKQEGGQKDNWGRSLNDQWYGFDPKTKKYTIAPYKIQELRKQAAGVSKYDPLYQKTIPSETTQQTVKNLPSQKKNINEAMAAKATERAATIKAVKNMPLVTEEQRNEILMNPQKLDEYSYLTRLQGPDTVKESIPYSAKERVWDIATNPFDAFEYAVRTGDISNMPRNYNKMKMAGIDPSAGGGANAVGNALNSAINLFDAGDKVVRNVGEGNYGAAALQAMRFLPGSQLSTGLGTKLYNTTAKVADVPGMPSYGKDLFYSLTHGRQIPQYKTATRWQPDVYPESLIQAGKKELTPEQQSLTGSWYGYSPSAKKIDPDSDAAAGFYMRTRPGAGNINTLKLSQRQINELEGAMPDFAKGMSGKSNTKTVSDTWKKGELNVPLELRQKAKSTRFDINPREYVPMPIASDISPKSNYAKIKGDIETGSFVNDVINSQYKPILGIPRKYFSYQKGGDVVCPVGYMRGPDGECIPEEAQDIPETVVYANEYDKKRQLLLMDQLRLAKGAYQDWKDEAGLRKTQLKNEGASSIDSLKARVSDYKKQLEEEKKTYNKADRALNILKKQRPDEWKNAKIKDVLSTKGIESLRSLYSEGKLSEGDFRYFYNNFGSEYDPNVQEGSGPGKQYSANEARQNWMENVPEFVDNVHSFAVNAALAPAMMAIGAPGILGRGAGALGRFVPRALGRLVPKAAKPFLQATKTAYQTPMRLPNKSIFGKAAGKTIHGATVQNALASGWAADTLMDTPEVVRSIDKGFTGEKEWLDVGADVGSYAFDLLTANALKNTKGVANSLKGDAAKVVKVLDKPFSQYRKNPIFGPQPLTRFDRFNNNRFNPLGTLPKINEIRPSDLFKTQTVLSTLLNSPEIFQNIGKDFSSGFDSNLSMQERSLAQARALKNSVMTGLSVSPLFKKTAPIYGSTFGNSAFLLDNLYKGAAKGDPNSARALFNASRLVTKQKGGKTNSYEKTLTQNKINQLIKQGYKIEYLD